MKCGNSIGKIGCYDPCAKTEEEAIERWNILNHMMVYLAAPYTHADSEIVAWRMEQFCIVDAALCHKGLITVSPLSKHFLKDHADIPLTWDFWKTYSIQLMKKCDALYVIMMPGWEESEGVQAEIELAKKMSKEIKYLDYLDFL